jgi:hypothetical protein
VQDELTITLPADLPAGQYRLAVGMYDPTNGQRLTTRDQQDQILLSHNINVR